MRVESAIVIVGVVLNLFLLLLTDPSGGAEQTPTRTESSALTSLDNFHSDVSYVRD